MGIVRATEGSAFSAGGVERQPSTVAGKHALWGASDASVHTQLRILTLRAAKAGILPKLSAPKTGPNLKPRFDNSIQAKIWRLKV